MENQLQAAIERWLQFNKKGRKRRASTCAQYVAHVNGLRLFLERRSLKLEEANRDDVLVFLRRYQTMWARRRALTAVRSLYEALNRWGTLSNTAPLSISLDEVVADVEAAAEAVQLQLFDNGWSRRDVAELTWGQALSLMAHGEDLSDKAARAIRTMASLHFPGRTLVHDVVRKRRRRVFVTSRAGRSKRSRI